MKQRATRARLLAPSFVVVASVIACGGASVGRSDGTGATAGTAGTSNGGVGSFGGSSNPPMPYCPGAAPANGAVCFAPIMCSYPPAAGPTPDFCQPPTTTASCAGGVWQVQMQLTSCNPPMPVSCPPTLPATGAPCPTFGDPNQICMYPAELCGQESARCVGGSWTAFRCEILGGQGGAGPDGIGGDVGTYGGEAVSGTSPGGQGGAP